jgi:hypothetical protein
VNVRVEIGRIVLHGIDVHAADRRALQSAVEAELGRLLAQPRSLALADAGGGSVPTLRGGEVRLGGSAAELGGRIARAVHQGLSA